MAGSTGVGVQLLSATRETGNAGVQSGSHRETGTAQTVMAAVTMAHLHAAILPANIPRLPSAIGKALTAMYQKSSTVTAAIKMNRSKTNHQCARTEVNKTRRGHNALEIVTSQVECAAVDLGLVVGYW